MKTFLKSELFFKIVSVVIAAILWLYVVQYENPEIQISVSNIPVRIENESYLAQNNLILTSQNRTEVDFKVKGKRQTVSNLDKNSMYAYIDMKSVTAAGEYNLPIKVSFSENNLSIADSSVPKVHITVENRITTEHQIKLKATGELKEGFYAVPEIPDMTVKVTSPESTAHLVTTVLAELEITGAETDVEKTVPLKLYDANNNVITSKNIRCDTESAKVKCMIYPVKDVPVKWTETGENPEYSKGISVSAKTVKIAGPANLLSQINSIDLGNINKSDFAPTNPVRTFSVKEIIGQEGVYITDKNSSIILTMKFDIPGVDNSDGIENESVDIIVEDIELTGIPEGYNAELVTNRITVKITGNPEVIKFVSSEDIKAAVDLSELTETELSRPYHEISARITTIKNVIIGQSEPVKIKISKQADG